MKDDSSNLETFQRRDGFAKVSTLLQWVHCNFQAPAKEREAPRPLWPGPPTWSSQLTGTTAEALGMSHLYTILLGFHHARDVECLDIQALRLAMQLHGVFPTYHTQLQAKQITVLIFKTAMSSADIASNIRDQLAPAERSL